MPCRYSLGSSRRCSNSEARRRTAHAPARRGGRGRRKTLRQVASCSACRAASEARLLTPPAGPTLKPRPPTPSSI
ncbi:hypothetical protein E2C01_029414 [Portunus trituberculatus]|uniref:Uncharacterized protein n=1 Tax=Portunus trituberculatus TaxID=210409 RepID=A0A5B7ERE4_PORTR|nr:hypothetical protein [Portunus trituberculatus]